MLGLSFSQSDIIGILSPHEMTVRPRLYLFSRGRIAMRIYIPFTFGCDLSNSAPESQSDHHKWLEKTDTDSLPRETTHLPDYQVQPKTEVVDTKRINVIVDQIKRCQAKRQLEIQAKQNPWERANQMAWEEYEAPTVTS